MSSFAMGSVMPERMAAIEAKLGINRGLRRPNDAFDAVLAASAAGTGLTADATAGTNATATATALPTSLLASLAGADPLSPVATRPSTAGAAVIEAASTHLGVPYLWGGTDPEKGFDCSGLIQHAFRQIGVELPKWSRHQATMGVAVDSIDEALPGDILTFGRPVTHVALYVGDGKMLHAPKRGEVVKIEDIDRTIGSIRRIVAPDAVAPPSGTAPAEVAPAGPRAVDPTEATTVSGHRPGEAEQRYTPLFEEAGRRWNVDPALLAAVAQVESNFKPDATSPAGARGLMQFMPATAAEMGVDAWDPASAIDGAARYLRTSLDRFPEVSHAIASYNAGRGAVQRYGGIPPYRETQNYVQKVLDAWKARS